MIFDDILSHINKYIDQIVGQESRDNMNFGSGPGMQLPRNFGNTGMNNGFNNNGINAGGFNNMNNGVANRVQPVKPVDRTFKSIDGTVWGSFEEATQHNKKYYYEQDKFKNNHFNK